MKNKYQIERNYISNTYARSKEPINDVEFLVGHETANNSADADDHQQYFDDIDFSASAHTFIDDKKILEIIPLDEKAWHVRYDVSNANDVAIGTELCRTGDFKKAYDRYVWYHAYLCQKFGLNPSKDIVAHGKLDPSRRSDPQSWLKPNGVSWNEFISDAQHYYDNWDGKKTVDRDEKVKPHQIIAVDGKWGSATNTALQQALNTVVDGVLSGQVHNDATDALYGGVEFGGGGSMVIEALQRLVGATVDGLLGPETIRKLQAYLGTVVDGVISRPSSMVVEELQRRLNKGNL